MTRRREERMGFWLQIVPAPGLTLALEREIERCVEDYADSHGLRLGGHQLAISVSSDERSRDLPNLLTSELESLFGGRLPVRPRVRFVKATSSAVWQIHRA